MDPESMRCVSAVTLSWSRIICPHSIKKEREKTLRAMRGSRERVSRPLFVFQFPVVIKRKQSSSIK
jgi:predicted aconitase